MILRYDQGMNTHPETPRPMPEPHDCTCRYVPCHVCADPTRVLDSGCPVHGESPEDKHLTDAEEDRPWEPLNERDLVPVGYEAEVNISGVTRRGVVGRVRGLDVCAIEGGFIGLLGYGTWYVRRPVQELPPERDGVALVPADGHEAITTTDGQEFARLTFTAKRSIWYGPNLAAQPGDFVIQTTSRSRLTPGTWKVDDQ